MGGEVSRQDMADVPAINSAHPEVQPSGFTLYVLKAGGKAGWRGPHLWIIIALFALFAYVYYGVLTTFHDIYVIIFFYPLIYAAIIYRMWGVLFSGVALLAIIIPQAVLFADDPISLVRTLIFALFAFLVSGMGATLLNYLEHQLDAYREILSLNEEMNVYIQRLKKAQQQLVQAAKLSSIGQLAAAVAHELNNPLAGALVYTRLMGEKLAREDFDKEQLKKNLAKVESAIDHCTDIIHGLLDFARQTEPRLRPVTVGRAIDKAVSLAGHQAKMKRIEVVREEAASLPLVVADFNQLVQVIINLMVNAVQAMKEGSRLTIRTGAADGWVRIAVSDTGCGIPAENMDKIFTPFFTTREEVKGVGLGLSVSYGIVERHGGRIEVESQVGRGSTFTIVLPAYQGNETAEN
jgi:signal transduction histidine kinase